jgi:type II restriction enzyme
MRDFDEWLKNLRKSLATWDYYTDFKKVYKKVNLIRDELNILNSLIGSKTIKNDFIRLVKEHPNILKVIPILLAKRELEISINDDSGLKIYNFSKPNYSINEYVTFMERTGLFDLLQNHVVSNLFEYVLGIEVGLDSNSRKNRTGDAMENIVEEYLIGAGLILNKTYFKEMYKNTIESKFNIDLSGINDAGKEANKRFDFVFLSNGEIYAIEVNFYSSGGSKLNETARSYKNIAIESRRISHFNFIWITDGIGWLSAKHNLEETFEELDEVFNLKNLEDGAIKKIVKG